ncbi:MAG: STAS domain-containing protein [Proteobacteria bacterium]|nr:STAS domain-containing protein [Pseudomonadota bacterium]MCL2307186.1 STAS domain-containing protein [Pseudomonadota bacterium]
MAKEEVRHTLTAVEQMQRIGPRPHSVGGSMSSASGLNAVLETAALMHASGQLEAARTVLEEAIATEPETAAMPLVWLALLDLYQQSGNQVAFERYGMEYAARFEQSPPVWVPRVSLASGQRPSSAEASSKVEVTSERIQLDGKITAVNKTLIEPLLHILDAPEKEAYQVDLTYLDLSDEEGALYLAQALAKVRRLQLNIVLEPWPQDLVEEAKIRAVNTVGKGGEGYWQLWLELLQWQQDETLFEVCALDFALRFELSPPAWEPARGLPLQQPTAAAETTKATETVTADVQEEVILPPNMIVWRGVLQGAHAPQLAAIKERLPLYDELVIDMHDVPRVDFSYGGALANLVARAEGAQKRVVFIRTSPMVLTLLLLVGIPPRVFRRRKK